MTTPGSRRLIAATLSVLASFSAAPTAMSSASLASPSSGSFRKGAAQFCFPALSAEEQARRYGRLVNLGASFTHGCLSCDSITSAAQANELTGDAFWIRRHHIAQFFTRADWKDPSLSAEGVFVLENDPKSKPSALVPKAALRSEGYSGIWHWNRARDDVQLLSRSEAEPLLSGTSLLQGASHVGGWAHREDLKVRPGTKHGVFFSAFSFHDGHYRALHEAFDFAVDGGRMQDVFSVLGAGDLIASLDASGWAAGPVRDEAVRRVVERLSAVEPGSVLAIDILFWDAIARTLSLAREKGTDSIVLRFLISALERTPVGQELFDEQRMAGVRAAFYEVLQRVSRGDDGRGGLHASPPPVLLARLLDDAATKLRAQGYEPIIAALVGEFVSRFIGRNIAGDLVDWLRAETSSSGSLASGEPRNQAFSGPRLSAKERARAKAALAELEKKSALDPTGRDDASGLPLALRGVATWVLLDVLKESGALLDYLGLAMDETNVHARAVTASASNNVHLVNADEFFLSFGAFLKPQTMHPSVAGARRMADMLTRAVCASQEEAP